MSSCSVLGDDDISSVRRSNSLAQRSSASTAAGGAAAQRRTGTNVGSGSGAAAGQSQKSAEKVVDLLGFEDDTGDSGATGISPSLGGRAGKEKALPAVATNPLDGERSTLLSVNYALDVA